VAYHGHKAMGRNSIDSDVATLHKVITTLCRYFGYSTCSRQKL